MIKKIVFKFEKRIEFFLKFIVKNKPKMRKISLYYLRKFFDWEIKSILVNEDSLTLCDLSEDKIFFARANRFSRYKNGIWNKICGLQVEYCTDKLLIPNDSLVVDIGANIGEFSIFWSKRGNSIVAFEPDPIEFKVLSKNLQNEDLYNIGLWNETKTLKFYSNNDTGDSSFIPSQNDQETLTLKVKRLDDFCFFEKKIGLIKLEAEGAEPEILDGGIKTFAQAMYVACDAGPERGVEDKTTVVPIIAKMLDLGFELVDFNHLRTSLLFANTRFQ